MSDSIGNRLVEASTALMDAADACFTKDEQVQFIAGGHLVGLMTEQMIDLREAVIEYRSVMAEFNLLFDKAEAEGTV